MMLPRLVQLLAIVALLIAPAGRIGLAEAAGPHHAPAMVGHCEDMGSTGEPTSAPAAIDCAIACAVVTPAAAPEVAAIAAEPAVRAAASSSRFSGVEPQADPPPPRPS